MKTAQEFARLSLELGQLSNNVQPAPDSVFPSLQILIAYHLRVAARHAKELAEGLAQKEETCDPLK